MTSEEIISLSINHCIEATKKAKKKNPTGVHPLYNDTIIMVEDIKIHAIKELFPEKLFKNRSPNETKQESDYIRNNYKNLTNPVWVDYLSTIGRPMGDGNWSIHYKEDAQEFKQYNQSFRSYVEKELPTYGSLENFIKFILPSIKSIDANGFLSVRPKEIFTEYNDARELVATNDLLEPTIFYFESKDVISYLENEYYLFLGKDKSIVTVAGLQEKTGNVFELYTEDAIYFIVQYGDKAEAKFQAEVFNKHDLGSCQVHQLMGIPHLKDDLILWQSPFSYSTDLLDLVAMNGNWEQAMINSSVFPVKVMFGSVCEFKDANGATCQSGQMNFEGKDYVCPSCNGQGLKSRISPLGTLLVNPVSKFSEGEQKSSIDPLKYVSPEVHTLEFIHEKVESDTMKARAILKLRSKNTSVTTNDGVTTATEIVDDAKGMYAFIKPISDQIFTIYEFLLTSIGKQRYADKFETPELSYPKTFDFKSAEDYLNDIASATANNLPPSFIQTILINYINAFYGDNENKNNIFKLVISADRIFSLSQDNTNLQSARGTIAKWEIILHSSVLNFINDAIELDAKFMDKKIEEQVKILQDRAKEIDKEINPAVGSVYAPPALQ